ncbi:MAG: hypothetical protein ACK4UV_11390, partial [Ignavibacterium sp.]
LIFELEQIVSALNTLDENNFDQKFPEIKRKMCDLHEITERTYYLYSESDQEKISNASKLIKEAFDNVLRKWMDNTEEYSQRQLLLMRAKTINL